MTHRPKPIAIIYKIIRAILLAMSLGYLSGCGVLIYGAKQYITVATINDKAPTKTRCILHNEEGYWESEPNYQTRVHRDGNPLQIQCVNQEQSGAIYINPSFNGKAFALDMLGLCLACPYDMYENAFFEYPEFVTLAMKEKLKKEYIHPILEENLNKHH